MANQHTQACGIAAMMNIFGDRWTWLLVREAFFGATRFTEFQRNTGASRNILSDRLNALVENGIFEQNEVGVSGHRNAYGLTEKGKALLPVMIAMGEWANQHEYGPGKEPVVYFNRANNQPLKELRFVDSSGGEISLQDISAAPGPGANAGTIRWLENKSGQLI